MQVFYQHFKTDAEALSLYRKNKWILADGSKSPHDLVGSGFLKRSTNARHQWEWYHHLSTLDYSCMYIEPQCDISDSFVLF